MHTASVFSIPVQQNPEPQQPGTDISNPEFGRIATDHMFVAEYAQGQWQNLRIEPFGNIALSPFAAGLHYGQTVFEGLKAFRTINGNIHIFRPQSHARRFNRSLERMCMPTVPEDMFLQAVVSLVKTDCAWVPAAPEASLYIRPFMVATGNKLGVKISDRYLFMIVCSPAGNYYSEPLKLKVEQHYTRACPGGTGFAKCGGNYGASYFPYARAHDEGFDQVIWTDPETHRYMEESGTMNLGFVIGNRFLTPSTGDTVLEGITRSSFLALAPQLGLHIEERRISYHEIVEYAEKGERVEAFGMGTAAVVSPIREIWADGHGHTFYTQADATMYQLKKALQEVRTGAVPDLFGWNFLVE